MAAAAAILVGVGLWGWQAGWKRGGGEVAQPKIPEPGAPPIASVQTRLANAGRVTMSMTRELAQQAAEQGRILVPRPNQFVPQELFHPWESPALNDEGVRKVGRVVSDGLEPVAQSTRRAFDMFMRMMPTDEWKPGS
jgi:hypothetical protein